MINNLPTFGAATPQSRAPSVTTVLVERVGGQIIVGCNFGTMEPADFPNIRRGICVSLFQVVEHKFPAESPAGRAGFPENGCGHFLEVGAIDAELRPVEDGFAPEQFAFHFDQFGRGDEMRRHVWVRESAGRQRPIDDGYPLGFHAASILLQADRFNMMNRIHINFPTAALAFPTQFRNRYIVSK